jgi:hypothetical protein
MLHLPANRGERPESKGRNRELARLAALARIRNDKERSHTAHSMWGFLQRALSGLALQQCGSFLYGVRRKAGVLRNLPQRRFDSLNRR